MCFQWWILFMYCFYIWIHDSDTALLINCYNGHIIFDFFCCCLIFSRTTVSQMRACTDPYCMRQEVQRNLSGFCVFVSKPNILFVPLSRFYCLWKFSVLSCTLKDSCCAKAKAATWADLICIRYIIPCIGCLGGAHVVWCCLLGVQASQS